MSIPVFVYDTGMVIALDRAEQSARLLHRYLTDREHPPVIPLPVLAQAWRPGRWTPVTRAVPECTVFGVRSSAPASCGVCLAGHIEDDAKRAGRILATAAIPEGKRPDAVDGLAVVIAARHYSSVIVTSDPRNITAYRDVLPDAAESVRVLDVADLPAFLAGKRVLR